MMVKPREHQRALRTPSPGTELVDGPTGHPLVVIEAHDYGVRVLGELIHDDGRTELVERERHPDGWWLAQLAPCKVCGHLTHHRTKIGTTWEPRCRNSKHRGTR